MNAELDELLVSNRRTQDSNYFKSPESAKMKKTKTGNEKWICTYTVYTTYELD